MRPAPGRAAGGRPRHAVKTALLVSAMLHSLLVLGFVLLRTRARAAETPVIDSRVPLAGGPFLLSFDDARPAGRRVGAGRSDSDSFPVSVAQSPPSSAADSGPAPSVDTRTLPPYRPGHGSGTGTAAGGAGASFFGAPIKGKSVVYVIDRSLSMGPSRALALARSELLASLEALPAAALFQIVFYNSAARPLRLGHGDGLLPADPEMLRSAAAIVLATCAEGNTDHVQALRCGLGLRPDVLFFITDADDLSREQVRVVTFFNGGRTVIHTVCLARRPQGTSALELLARANGGRCLCPRTAKHLP